MWREGSANVAPMTPHMVGSLKQRHASFKAISDKALFQDGRRPGARRGLSRPLRGRWRPPCHRADLAADGRRPGVDPHRRGTCRRPVPDRFRRLHVRRRAPVGPGRLTARLEQRRAPRRHRHRIDGSRLGALACAGTLRPRVRHRQRRRLPHPRRRDGDARVSAAHGTGQRRGHVRDDGGASCDYRRTGRRLGGYRLACGLRAARDRPPHAASARAHRRPGRRDGSKRPQNRGA